MSYFIHTKSHFHTLHILYIEKIVRYIWYIKNMSYCFIHSYTLLSSYKYYNNYYIDTNTHTYTPHTILSQCLISECIVFSVALSLDKWSDVILCWSTSVHETSLVFFLFSLSKRQHPVLHKWNNSKKYLKW